MAHASIDMGADPHTSLVGRGSNLVARGLDLLILIYQRLVSPVLPASCRYTPSCSQYARDAIRRHGPLRGTWMAIRRVSRCHPWGGSGHDPVR